MKTTVVSLLVFVLLASAAFAGGGPENVAVVVNADSWASQTVANEFIHLRRIPACNVVYLSLGPTKDFGTVEIDFFREKVLSPVLAAIKERGLTAQIDCIAYSTDLPNTVHFTSDLPEERRPRQGQPDWNYGSATGLTYLYQRTLEKGNYTDLQVNKYARIPADMNRGGRMGRGARGIERMIERGQFDRAEQMLEGMVKADPNNAATLYAYACVLAEREKQDQAFAQLSKAVDNGFKDAGRAAAEKHFRGIAGQPRFKSLLERMKKVAAASKPAAKSADVVESLAFGSQLAWRADGKVDTDGRGEKYMLSTMLAWTSGRGNSVPEALDCLRRAAGADGSVPKGTVYFQVNDDIRSKTRLWGFDSAIAALKELGVAAETQGPGMPDKKEVAGYVSGIMYFSFRGSGSTFCPGAIAEHLTSYGGNLDEGCDQSPMTEWIRCGAAGTSGTVTEPYAIQNKFPLPHVQLYYARGCTLAEAFYQSVIGPYQLLILGDPLCKPWAKVPQVNIEDLPRGPVKGELAIVPAVQNGIKPRRWELFVDGKRTLAAKPQEKLKLDTRKLADGWHELRVVAVSDDAIQTQGEARASVVVSNGGRTATAKLEAQKVPFGQAAKVQASVRGAAKIMLMHNGRCLATAEGAEATLSVDSRLLGSGTVQLQAVGVTDEKGGAMSQVASEPLTLTIEPPEAMEAAKIDAAKLVEGPMMTVGDEKPVLMDDKSTIKYGMRNDWLSRMPNVKPETKFTVAGYVTAEQDEMHQFQLYTDGQCELVLDGKTLSPANDSSERMAGKPVSDAKGWQFFPVNLKKGEHNLIIKATAGPNRVLNVRFGGRGTWSLTPKKFKHV